MHRSYYLLLLGFIFSVLCTFYGCGYLYSDAPLKEDLVYEPEEIDQHVNDHLHAILSSATDTTLLYGQVNLHELTALKDFYEHQEAPLWSSNSIFNPIADSLLEFFRGVKYNGLDPQAYHVSDLEEIFHRLSTDSTAMHDAMLWSQADLMITDGLFHCARHLHYGRIPPDSLTLRSDSVPQQDFFEGLIQQIKQPEDVRPVLESLEPQYRGYIQLKKGLRALLQTSGTLVDSTQIQYPVTDSALFQFQLKKRLQRHTKRSVDSLEDLTSSKSLRKALLEFQGVRGLKQTGKADFATIEQLNRSDLDVFRIVAINMDRYKLLPDTLPIRYIWVNIPSYTMQVWDTDTLVFTSKVIVGKSETRTPKLTSKITDMLTYPQWTIPTSIIVKEVLPAAQKDPGYFSKKGYMVVNAKGEEVDPYTIPWQKFKKGIPYKVVQGSGDDNALGILKFNFSNRYSVYMHDTNQRYLFKQSQRSMSHGCVRVEQWRTLASYLLSIDSASRTKPVEGRYPAADSLQAWLNRKEKHYLPLKNRMPLFIRYFTASYGEEGLQIYPDIYQEDVAFKNGIFAFDKID